MDAQERKVIRWKRDLVAANLTLDEETIQRLKSHDLIWDSIISDINESDIKNCEKVWKYLEYLMKAKLDRNVFNSFCEFLDEENPWISSELRVELSLERGQLKLDDYIKNEAATLIHRYFGTTKRISEGEKRQFEEILARRTQCTKNIWIKNVEQTKQSLIAQVALERQRISAMKLMIKNISKYFSENPDELVEDKTSTDILTERDAFRWMNQEAIHNVTKRLEGSVDRLIKYAENCKSNLEDKKNREEKMENKIKKTLSFLTNGKYNRKNKFLEEDIQDLIDNFNDKLLLTNQQAHEKEELYDELKTKIDQVQKTNEEELKERDRHIRFLADNLERVHKDSEHKEEKIGNISSQYADAQEKLVDLEDKVKYWERYRHFGYWYDKKSEIGLQNMRNLNMEKKGKEKITGTKKKRILNSSSKVAPKPNFKTK